MVLQFGLFGYLLNTRRANSVEKIVRPSDQTIDWGHTVWEVHKSVSGTRALCGFETHKSTVYAAQMSSSGSSSSSVQGRAECICGGKKENEKCH